MDSLRRLAAQRVTTPAVVNDIEVTNNLDYIVLNDDNGNEYIKPNRMHSFYGASRPYDEWLDTLPVRMWDLGWHWALEKKRTKAFVLFFLKLKYLNYNRSNIKESQLKIYFSEFLMGLNIKCWKYLIFLTIHIHSFLPTN